MFNPMFKPKPQSKQQKFLAIKAKQSPAGRVSQPSPKKHRKPQGSSFKIGRAVNRMI